MLFHVDVDHLVELLLVLSLINAAHQHALDRVVNIVALGLGLFMVHAGDAAYRPDSDVLCQELFSGEIVHEVLSSDIALLFFVFFNYNLFKLFEDSYLNLFKDKRESLVVLKCLDIFIELLVDLLDDSAGPTKNLVVNQPNFLVKLLSLLLLFPKLSEFLINGSDLWIDERFLFFTIELDLQIVESLSPRVVLLAKVVDLSLVVTDCHKQLGIRVLASEELVNDFLDVREPGSCPDFLECVFYILSSFHFFLHLSLEKGTPESLHHEVLLHFEFIGVFVLVGSGLRYFLLSPDSLHPPLECFLLVPN